MNLTMEEALELCELEHPGRIPAHISCPFHDENTPSLAVWDDHYFCFGCQKGGSSLDFVASIYHCDYRTAAKLAARTIEGILDRPARERKEPQLLDLTDQFERETVGWHEDALKFVKDKWPHLTVGDLEFAGVTAGRYNLLIPHWGLIGGRPAVVGVKTRSLLPARLGAKAAFPGSTFTSQLYYVRMPARATRAILVEGESDCWTLTKHYSDDPDVAVYGLPSGARCWKESFKAELDRYEWITLYLDPDDTGREAAAHIQKQFDRKCLDFFLDPQYEDVTDAYIKGWRP